MFPRPALAFALAVLLYPSALIAQTVQADFDGVAPAHVSHVEGAVSLEREGRPENAPLNMPLLSGDRLKTLEGRAEVLFADGSALHLDTRTTLDIQSDDLVRLIDGRVRLNISGPPRNLVYRVDSPAGSVRITQPGEYRLALLHSQTETQLELAVLRGGGEIFTDQGSTPVRAGERAYSSDGLAPSYPYAFNSASWDAFDQWSEARRDTRRGVSAQYLPEDVRTYSSTFDEYGDWRYQQSYGYVWYPRVVADWRPYYYGRWAAYPRYGWTWIGIDAFAWPTHHYGRWGFSAGAWFWIPASRWAPAYVSWAYAPGYVSWCPLGFDNRAVIGLDIYRVGPGYYSGPRAWTAVAYSQFGRDYYVHQRAVSWDRAGAAGRPRFEVAPAAPAYRSNIAVPRGSSAGSRAAEESRSATPIQWAGARDPAPRPDSGALNPSSAPRYINRGDQIVRSRTEHPTAQAAAVSAPGASPDTRAGSATPRTSPQGPARRVDATPQSSAVPRDYRQGTSAPIGGAAAPYDRRAGTPGSTRPDVRTYAPRGEQPRADAPAYAAPRTGQPRADSPAYAPRIQQPRGDAPTNAPRANEPAPRPTEYARPRGGAEEPRPAPSAPSAGERRAPPPPQHAAPPPPAPSSGRDGGRAAPPAGSVRRGGRGGL